MLDITGALGPEVPSFRAAGGENFEYHLRFNLGPEGPKVHSFSAPQAEQISNTIGALVPEGPKVHSFDQRRRRRKLNNTGALGPRPAPKCPLQRRRLRNFELHWHVAGHDHNLKKEHDRPQNLALYTC